MMRLRLCHEYEAEISSHAKTRPHSGVRKPFMSGLDRKLKQAAETLFRIELAGLLLLLLMMC